MEADATASTLTPCEAGLGEAERLIAPGRRWMHCQIFFLLPNQPLTWKNPITALSLKTFEVKETRRSPNAPLLSDPLGTQRAGPNSKPNQLGC